MITCKDACNNYNKGNKKKIYEDNGSFCRNCDYYFEDEFSRCPCCNALTRHNAKNSGELKQVCRI